MSPRIPDALNRPPIILDTGRRPVQPTTTVFIGSNCVIPEFVVLVDDDSPAVLDRWIIDPTSANLPADGLGSYGLGPTPGVSGKPRTITANGDFLNDFTKVTNLEVPHAVEVIITDGKFHETSTGLSFESNSQGVDELGNLVDQPEYHTSFKWLVTVSKAACP